MQTGVLDPERLSKTKQWQRQMMSVVADVIEVEVLVAILETSGSIQILILFATILRNQAFKYSTF